MHEYGRDARLAVPIAIGLLRIACDASAPVTISVIRNSVRALARALFSRDGSLKLSPGSSTLPVNLCPLSGSGEFARLADNLGEPVGEAVEASARPAMWQLKQARDVSQRAIDSAMRAKKGDCSQFRGQCSAAGGPLRKHR